MSTDPQPSPRRRPWALWLWTAGLCSVLLTMCAAPLFSDQETTFTDGQLDSELAGELVAPPEVAPPATAQAPSEEPGATEPEPRPVFREEDSADEATEEPADPATEPTADEDAEDDDPPPSRGTESFLTPSDGDPEQSVVSDDVPDLRRAAIRLDGNADSPGHLETVRNTGGVADATSITFGEISAAGSDGEMGVTFAGIDVEQFRPFTPEVSASHQDLWERIASGDAAFTHHKGYELDLVLGGWFSPGGNVEDDPVNHFSLAATNIDIADPDAAGNAEQPDDPQSVRVGAFASNGVPPVADVMVSAETAAEMGVDDGAALLVAVDDDADIEALAEELGTQTGLTVEIIPEPVPQTGDSPDIPSEPEGPQDQPTDSPAPPPVAEEEIVPFNYIDNGDGTIQIEQEWVDEYIVTERLPIFEGNATCHRVMMPRLIGALEEVENRGLDHLIDTNDYGGCWVARHIDWNPARSLSMHAWGLAVDFNVQTNQLGAEPQMDRRIVEIFESWGFTWGGHWNRPDGMHFEYGNPPV